MGGKKKKNPIYIYLWRRLSQTLLFTQKRGVFDLCRNSIVLTPLTIPLQRFNWFRGPHAEVFPDPVRIVSDGISYRTKMIECNHTYHWTKSMLRVRMMFSLVSHIRPEYNTPVWPRFEPATGSKTLFVFCRRNCYIRVKCSVPTHTFKYECNACSYTDRTKCVKS